MVTRIFLFSILYFFSLANSTVFAQWQLGVKNLVSSPEENIQLFLSYEAASEAKKTFKADIRFWTGEDGNQKVYLRREATLTTDRSKVFSFGFHLPEGSYQVDANIFDPDLGKYSYNSIDLPINVNTYHRDALVSDILLSYNPTIIEAIDNPLLSELLDPDNVHLYYFLEVYGLNGRRLTTRATLYKENGQKVSNTSAYTSLHQRVRILESEESDRGVFGDTLTLSTLEPGEYMIQVLIYEGEYLLSQEKAWFILGANTKQRVLADLEESIRMLVYILPDATIDNLIQEPPGEVQKTAFLNSWKLLYQEDTDTYLESYYEKMFEANERFKGESKDGDSLKGWQTDRGRIFIQYGDPTEKNIEIKGKPYLLWTYAGWSLSFLFEPKDQQYILVKT
ncbi:MAG: GWxTD domain-containing protein [Bacteroidota bacterium]